MNDNEDIEFNQQVKVALESRDPFVFCSIGSARRWRKWSLPALLAASLVIFVIPKVLFTPVTSPIVDAIELLSAADGVDLVETTLQSPSELLLAWQDIPYIDSF